MSTPLRIAILINTTSSQITTSNKPTTRTCFLKALVSNQVANEPTVDFYDPIIAQTYPDPNDYNLVVLSGGTADPSGSDAWVLKLKAWLKHTTELSPKLKFVGICWGHQIICVTFGGEVGSREHAEVGIKGLRLTQAGKDFFSSLPGIKGERGVNIHEFHKREIKVPAPGFSLLAEENQIFLHQNGNLLTFQGHPEMDNEFLKVLLSSVPQYMGVDEEEKARILSQLEEEMGCDGGAIWTRVLTWVSGD